MNNDYDISQIENYLQGRMDNAERQAFEANLTNDKDLQTEVEVYRKILSGFGALKEQAFAEQVAQWTEAAKNNDRQNVVPMAKRGVVRSLWQRVAVAASVVLLLGLAGSWWASQQFSDETLVAAAYSPPRSGNTMGGTDNQAVNELEKQFTSAHQDFKENRYEEAAGAFSQIVQQLQNNPALFDKVSHQFYLDNAKWTGLLAQFAAGQVSDEAMIQSLDEFANDPASNYSEKAKAMKKDLGSIWRRIGG